MDKHEKLSETLKVFVRSLHPQQMIHAEVVSVQGESCTVKVKEVDIKEVRLKATINGNGNKILLTPKVGSKVIIGSLSGDLKDLVVLKVDEVAQLEYEENGLNILVDSSDGRLSIKNGHTSLKDILQELANLLKQFTVFTPAGPSGTPLPDTLSAITKFEMDFKLLIK